MRFTSTTRARNASRLIRGGLALGGMGKAGQMPGLFGPSCLAGNEKEANVFRYKQS